MSTLHQVWLSCHLCTLQFDWLSLKYPKVVSLNKVASRLADADCSSSPHLKIWSILISLRRVWYSKQSHVWIVNRSMQHLEDFECRFHCSGVIIFWRVRRYSFLAEQCPKINMLDIRNWRWSHLWWDYDQYGVRTQIEVARRDGVYLYHLCRYHR